MAESRRRRGRPLAEAPDAVTGAVAVDRVARIANIERRLADGYSRIDVAQGSGADTGVWEDYWISLLHSYEALCDGLDLEQAA